MGIGLSNPTHIALIAVVLLLVFGARRLPEMGRSLGLGLREFKDSLAGSCDPARMSTVAAAEARATPDGPSAAPAGAHGTERA